MRPDGRNPIYLHQTTNARRLRLWAFAMVDCLAAPTAASALRLEGFAFGPD